MEWTPQKLQILNLLKYVGIMNAYNTTKMVQI